MNTPPAPAYRVLFVCLGNICRSPAAEIIFKHMVQQAGLSSSIISDSAGISDWHRGESPDSRMIAALKEFGYRNPGVHARPVHARDLEQFDLILGMDNDNLLALNRLNNRVHAHANIQPMCSFARRFHDTFVPDPYFGGHDGFVHVVELLQDCCSHLLEYIQNSQLQHKNH